MKKIIVCPDSFKGSISSVEAAHTIANELKSHFPNTEIISIPLADGGEGTSEILESLYPLTIDVKIKNALGQYIPSSYKVSNNGEEAFIESAKIIGLPLIPLSKRNPLNTSSYGLGEIIKHAIKRGVKKITVSLGGSATNDGGMGMLHALGFKFYDINNNELSGTGKDLLYLKRIDFSRIWSEIDNINFTILCDVDNPLLGPLGCSTIYSPQKGANPAQAIELEKGMENFVKVLTSYDSRVKHYITKESAGAAGGLGFAFLFFFNATRYKGIEYILNSLDFTNQIKNCDLIITGEGKLDKQSLMGKTISGVLKEASNLKKDVIVICGNVEDEEVLVRNGIKAIYPIRNTNLSHEENLKPEMATLNLKKAVKNLIKDLCDKNN